jgi:YVTN family beta-propeller protein
VNQLPIDPDAVVATISLGGHAGVVATSPDGNHAYVVVADSVKVISRLHNMVATYHTGRHPKDVIVSADGTHVYVTGYDGSTSIIRISDNTAKTVVLDRSSAEVVSPDGAYIYLAHSGIVGDTRGSSISVVNADGAPVAVVPVDSHATGLALSPDGNRLYVASSRHSANPTRGGSISVIDTETYTVVNAIAMQLAPDTVTMSRDGARLYATHYRNNAISIVDVETGGVTAAMLADAPIDVAVSPDGAFAYVTNLHSLAVIDTAANVAKVASVGALPRATHFSANGKHAYTIDFARQSIRTIETADNSVVGSVQLEGHPEALAISADGEFIYVTDYLNGTLTVISTALVRPRAEET